MMLDTASKLNSRTIMIAFLALISLVSLSASTWRALSISNSHTPIVNISKDIKYQVAVFHLWLEEYISGDDTLHESDVWKHMNRAKTLSNILLNSGEYLGKKVHLPINGALRKNIGAVLEEIEKLDELAKTRIVNSQDNQAGSKTDAGFDEQFELVQEMLFLVDDAISVFIGRDISRFLLLNVGTALIILIFSIALFVVLAIKERERKEADAQIIQASKLATLGEMATSVAHELSQPLNVIRMAARNSRQRISNGPADLDYLNDKLERIEAQTARAATIIDHMRVFGREAKELPEPIDPRNIVSNALDLMGEQLRLAGIEIVVELAEDCPSVYGHAIQLEQVILNLLVNAMDAMVESDGETKVTLRVFEKNKSVHITSEDTGGGILEAVLPRIFEPFYTTKGVGKGTGLGLSVTYGIVRDMKGTVVAENIDGGARFTITLPTVG